jgi:LytS/YehU family sensor histidine kinase
MAIIEEDKQVAIEYVGKLSAFFRNILEYRNKELIPLSEELKVAESYIFLQKKRYGENLHINIDPDEKFLSSLIPPLTLQLLIENAVKHNIVSESRPLLVSIRSEQDTLIVENTLQLKKTPEISTGMGLENIRSRYRMYTNREILIRKTEKSFSVYLPVIIKKAEGL